MPMEYQNQKAFGDLTILISNNLSSNQPQNIKFLIFIKSQAVH